jgi:hypothetical protein
VTRTRIVLDVEGPDEGAILRFLRALLKRLGRDCGVRCVGARVDAERST